MNIFEKRPLLLSLFIFVGFSAVCLIIPTHLKLLNIVICIAAVVTLGVLFLVLKIRNKKADISFLIFLCAVSVLLATMNSYRAFDIKLKEIRNLSEENSVVAEIHECTYRASYTADYTARIIKINGAKKNFYAKITSEKAVGLEAGDIICANMIFQNFPVLSYGYDLATANLPQGIIAYATFSDTIYTDSNAFDSGFFYNARKFVSETVDKCNFKNVGPLIKALLIGDRSELEDETNLAFERLGISHILSISGTHFTVLLGMIMLLLSLFGVNKKVIYFVLIPIAIFYMGLSGFSPSVCRAGIMSLMAYMGFLLGRTKDSYTSLFVAMVLLLTVTPYTVTSIGLWLSFSATFTILIILDIFSSTEMFSKHTSWYKKILFFFISRMIITLAVSFTSLPIITMTFGVYSIATPLANITIVPLFELFLYLAPLAVLFSNFPLLLSLIDYLGGLILKIALYFSKYNNLLVSLDYTAIKIISFIGVVVTVIMIILPLKRKIWLLVPFSLSIILIIVSVSLITASHSEETHISYFRSGTNDGIMAIDNNKAMYIDVSCSSPSFSYFASGVANDHNCPEISTVVFTHYRSRHTSMFKKLASTTRIHRIYLPVSLKEEFAQICKIASEQNIVIRWYSYGEEITFEDTKTKIFEPQYAENSTHEVVSFGITANNKDFLYLGSSFSRCKEPLDNEIKSAEYIFLGQHYPKAKEYFELKTDAELIYGNEHVYNLSLSEKEAYLLTDGGLYDIMLK